MKSIQNKIRNCRICPVECGADRTKGAGRCGAGKDIEISSWNLHFGEEPVLVGTRSGTMSGKMSGTRSGKNQQKDGERLGKDTKKNGSGTIFFTHCSLKCVFCQNYPISHLGHGRVVSSEELSEIILKLQSEGAHNINLVTPTHYAMHIKAALKRLRPHKLRIPVVYNCGGYEKVETLKKLEGLIDIYMPDAKFSLEKLSAGLTSVADYPEINRQALREMYRQTGKAQIGPDGLMKKGMIVRHLVLPGLKAKQNSKEVLKFLSEEFNGNIYLSLMAQYHPAYRSSEIPFLSKRLTAPEYKSIVNFAGKLDFKKGYYQEL